MWTGEVHEERLEHGLEEMVEYNRCVRRGDDPPAYDASGDAVAFIVMATAAILSVCNAGRGPRSVVRKIWNSLRGKMNSADNAPTTKEHARSRSRAATAAASAAEQRQSASGARRSTSESFPAAARSDFTFSATGPGAPTQRELDESFLPDNAAGGARASSSSGGGARAGGNNKKKKGKKKGKR